MNKAKKLWGSIFIGGKTNSSMNAGSFERTSIQSRHFADIRLAQNVLLIWLDSSINDISSCNIIKQFKNIFNNVNIFTDTDQCVDFLSDIINAKAFMIVSGTLGQHVVPIIHDISQLDSIYIFCRDKPKHEQWSKDWYKVKGVFSESSTICQILEKAARQYEQNIISLSFLSTSNNLNQFNQSFMYTQVLKDILLKINFKSLDFNEFIDYCRELFINNETELKIIKELKNDYSEKNAILWYTRECFLYRMLNRILRSMEFDTIIKMGFFIKDLHRHIEHLHSKQLDKHHFTKPFIVYRGQGLSRSDFNQMLNTKGGFVSFNNFVSTSKDCDICFEFIQRTLKEDQDLIGILYVMKIDPQISFTPFADIGTLSCHRMENEILFSMHTIFRIEDIKNSIRDNRIWEVELIQTNEKDHDLSALTERMRNEIKGLTGWDGLGRFFIKLGQWNKAQQVYEAMLDKASNDLDRANVYHQLGWIKDDQGEYDAAISLYKKSLEILKRISPQARKNFADSYNNIGVIYDRMGDYSNALSFYEQALEIRKETLHANHPELANSYTNLGLVYKHMNDYAKAQLYLEKGLEIREKLPHSHPDLAQSYNNLGLLHKEMNDDSKAQLYHKKAFQIKKQILPSNHPNLVKTSKYVQLTSCKKPDPTQAIPINENPIHTEQLLSVINQSNIQINKKNSKTEIKL